MRYFWHILRAATAVAALLAVAFWLGGCASVEEAEGERQDSVRAERAPSGIDLNLVAPGDDVRTVQLYRGDDERALPVLPLGSGDALTLEFDLMEEAGRPLSVYFYHADRTWRRDLTPIEYLEAFQNDNLLDYTPARGTVVPYVHYTYRFPNPSIDFRISGNYVVRVTEQGQEDAVLFERAFFVTEQRGRLGLAFDRVMVSGQEQPSVLPVAQFQPPASLQGNVFDYNVCFVRNGQFAAPRCSSRPRLAAQPLLAFELERRQAFAPQPADYFLDIGNLRIGPSIEAADLTASPPQVILKPDYARFAGSSLDPPLAGQVLVEGAVTDVAEPDVAAEYASVRFSFVPPEERPLGAAVVVAGSFGGREAGRRLGWVPERGRYEGEVLVKQGHYEYYYTSPDPALRRVLRRGLARPNNRYTAFVYYADPSLGTDRLLAVEAVDAL